VCACESAFHVLIIYVFTCEHMCSAVHMAVHVEVFCMHRSTCNKIFAMLCRQAGMHVFTCEHMCSAVHMAVHIEVFCMHRSTCNKIFAMLCRQAGMRARVHVRMVVLALNDFTFMCESKAYLPASAALLCAAHGVSSELRAQLRRSATQGSQWVSGLLVGVRQHMLTASWQASACFRMEFSWCSLASLG